MSYFIVFVPFLTPAPMKPTPDATLAATRAWSAFVKPNCETSVNMQAPIATRDLFPGKQWEGWWEGEGGEE